MIKTALLWERIAFDAPAQTKDQQPTEMFRLKVPGGWLVAAAWGGIQPGGLVLLPDQRHEWTP
jgi:hypothetical protein